MQYLHPKVDHTNGKQFCLTTTIYALNFKVIQMKKLMNEKLSPKV
jgi:hypothetical protein